MSLRVLSLRVFTLKIAVLFSLLVTGVTAHALIIMFEPFAGYSINSSYDSGVSGSDTIAMTGLNYGGRLGVVMNRLYFGAEYESVDFTLDDSDDPKFKSNHYGLFIGYGLTHRIRFLATYYIGPTGTLEGNNTELDLGDGQAWKAALYVRVWRRLSVFAEYTDYQFGTTELNGTEVSGRDDGATTVQMGLSFPFFF